MEFGSVMFEHFSFKQNAVAHGSSTTSTANSTAVSPTSTRSSSPSLHQAGSSSTSILELSRQFSEHSIDQCLRRAPALRPSRQPSTDPSPSHSHDSSIRSSRSSTSSFSSLLSNTTNYSDMSSTAIRLQRQAHTRMQAENTHLRDISTLVQKMINDGDQCMVCTHPSEEPSSAGTAASTTPAVQSSTLAAAAAAAGAAAATTASPASDSGTNDGTNTKTLRRGHKRAASAVLPYATKYRKSGDGSNSHASRTMRVRKQVSDRAIRRCR